MKIFLLTLFLSQDDYVAPKFSIIVINSLTEKAAGARGKERNRIFVRVGMAQENSTAIYKQINN